MGDVPRFFTITEGAHQAPGYSGTDHGIFLSRIPLNLDFNVPPRGCVSICVHAAGDGSAQVILAAVFADFCGYIADDDHAVVALQRDGGGAGVCLSGFADRAFHHVLLRLNVSSQIAGSGQYMVTR